MSGRFLEVPKSKCKVKKLSKKQDIIKRLKTMNICLKLKFLFRLRKKLEINGQKRTIRILKIIIPNIKVLLKDKKNESLRAFLTNVIIKNIPLCKKIAEL